MDFKKNTGLRVAVWPEPSNTGTMLGGGKGGEGINLVPKVAVREECSPYFPDETEGAHEWWTCGSLSFLPLAGAVPFLVAAPHGASPQGFSRPAVQFHELSRDREAGSRTCQEPTYL